MVCYFFYLKKAPKSRSNSKIILKGTREMLTNWTIEGMQHQKIWIRHKCAYLTICRMKDISKKTKSISSAEPNYFVHFAMRCPVFCNYCKAEFWQKNNYVPFKFFSVIFKLMNAFFYRWLNLRRHFILSPFLK